MLTTLRDQTAELDPERQVEHGGLVGVGSERTPDGWHREQSSASLTVNCVDLNSQVFTIGGGGGVQAAATVATLMKATTPVALRRRVRMVMRSPVSRGDPLASAWPALHRCSDAT